MRFKTDENKNPDKEKRRENICLLSVMSSPVNSIKLKEPKIMDTKAACLGGFLYRIDKITGTKTILTVSSYARTINGIISSVKNDNTSAPRPMTIVMKRQATIFLSLFKESKKGKSSAIFELIEQSKESAVETIAIIRAQAKRAVSVGFVKVSTREYSCEHGKAVEVVC